MKKTKLSEKEIKHLAKLANLTLTQDEIKNYSQQLSTILEYIEQLNEINTDNVISTSSTADLTNNFREDKSSEEQKLKIPDNQKISDIGGKKYFKVKRII